MAVLERSFQKLTRTSLRRAASWLLLGLVLTGVVGIPVPERKRLAGDAPFPCQDRPCGCATADSCWRQCCCFTDSEKLVWAEQHGVTPPEHVVRAARIERMNTERTALCATSSCDAPASRAPSCGSPISGASRPSCCSEVAEVIAPGDEEPAAPATKDIATEESADSVESSSAVVLLEAYQRCRGLASVYKQLVEGWVPQAAPRVEAVPRILYRLAVVHASPVERIDAPEPPVPWV